MCVCVSPCFDFSELCHIYSRFCSKLTVSLRVQKKVTMDYGFPSLDEELAKDHLDGENA